MLHHNESLKTIEISNRSLTTVIDYNNGVILKEFTNIFGTKKTNVEKDLFCLKIYDCEYTSKDFDIVDIITADDMTEEILTFLLERKSDSIKVKIHFMNNKEDSMKIIFQVYDGYKFGCPHNCYLRIPLIAGLEAKDSNDIVYCPGNPVSTSGGKQIIMPMRESYYDSDIKLPLIVCDSDNKVGFSVSFPNISDLNDGGATQNIGKLFSAMSTKDEFKNHYVRINPDASFNDTVELLITGIKGGWVEAFDRYRDYWASNYDFSEYNKEDLKWFNNCAVHNFTFLYGKQGFDFEKQTIDVDKLLEEGKEFGGYDTVILWNQYPRLGIDSRTQWDFYDDFPGGREAFKRAVEKFHDNEVYVFLPYIPWDRGNAESTLSMGEEFVKIVKDTNADGYHLDTMMNIPYSYRKELDKIRPGIVLMPQGHPAKKHAIEILTASWDEFWRFDPMPEIDILRFICPMHIAPVISRWLRYEDRKLLIKRSKFSASPIVIWQDIFGRWMPFADDQKKEIKEWKKIYLSYKNIYQGLKPVPLYPTYTENLYCNIFSSDVGKEQIYSFYNDTDDVIDSEYISLYGEGHKEAKVILGDGNCYLEGEKLRIKISPKDVLHVLVK